MAVGPIDDPALRSQIAAGPIYNLFEHRATLQAYLDAEAALARAQAQEGLIPVAAAEAITRAARVENLDLDRYAADVSRLHYPIAPLVDQLVEIVPDGLGEWAHWGATTQDIVDTGRVLQMKAAFDVIDGRLRDLGVRLKELADRYRATPMAGRSMLQHAVPIPFGYKAAVWASMLDRQLDRLPSLRSEILVAQLGGAAGTLAAMGDAGTQVRAAFAHELGLGDPGITWHTARDRVAETVHYLALVCACLGKIGLDVVLLAQTDVGEMFESGSGGSSTMPHKRNPVRSQVLLVAARVTRQLAGAALESVVADHERGTGAWMTEWWSATEAFVICGGALEHSVELVAGLTIDPERMAANLEATGGLLMSEAVMMALAPKIGRHAAHRLLDSVIQSAAGSDFRTALRATPEIGEHIDLDELDRALDPAAYLGVTGDMIGFVLDS